MSLFLFFSKLIIRDFQASNNVSVIIISSFIIAIPGTFIILIIIQFHNLFKSKFSPGNNFKKNIVTYFILTTFMVVIPQVFISLNFLDAASSHWLNKKVQEAVDIGFNMALDIENRYKKDLLALSKNSIFKSAIINIYNDNSIRIDEITSLNSLISSIDILNNYGTSEKALGDSLLHVHSIDLSKKETFYPKLLINNKEIIFYQFRLKINNENKVIIIGAELPTNYTKNGTLLTSVKNSLDLTTENKRDINFGIFVYYLLFSLPVMLLAILGSFIFSDEIIKPLIDLEEAITRVSKGNYSYRILSKKKNEFYLIINSFNNMIKEIEKSRNKLKHTEQISTWQDIATRLAHEIKNPLTPIKLSAQRVLLKEENSITSKYMETIISEVTRMEKLLNEFRDFARFPNLNIGKASIKETIIEAVNIYPSVYPDIIFDFSSVSDILVDMDKSQIIQVISNLTINGIHAMESKGVLKYSSEEVHKKGIDYCRVSIKDNGTGIPKNIMDDIFKPYFTTKYNGSGLGLAIVNKIILDHKGKIWIESAENAGTTFYFEFPKVES